jgi:hypothetical protein
MPGSSHTTGVVSIECVVTAPWHSWHLGTLAARSAAGRRSDADSILLDYLGERGVTLSALGE